MVDIQSLLDKLNASGVHLYLDGNTLKSNSSKDAITAEIAASIRGNKEAIVAFLKAQAADQITALSAEQRAGLLPLSYAQKRLWFVDSLEQNAQHYYVNACFELEGALNISVLTQALQKLVARHEILRTNYVVENGEVYGKIASQWHVPVRVEYISQNTASQSQQLQNLIRQHSQKSFDLRHDLMLRCLIVKLQDNLHVLVMTQHHIASDGQSADILVKELSELYYHGLDKEHNSLTPLTLQYADYAAYSQANNNKLHLEDELQYWRSQLQDIPQVHSLKLASPRPVKRTFDGNKVERVLSSELNAKVCQLAARYSVTPYMLLHAVFSVLLSRYSRQKDIVIGTPVNGRRHPQVRDMLGIFVNSLVLRSNVAQDMLFTDLLQQSKDTIANALSHANAPFDMVVEAVNPDRSTSHEPLFQIQYLYENANKRQLNLPGLSIQAIDTDVNVTRFDLELAVVEQGAELHTIWTYNVNLFQETFICGMALHFENLLTAILAEPTRSVASYPLLDRQEKQLLCEQWNITHPQYQVNNTLHGLFLSQVQATPENIAIIDEHGSVTYEALFASVYELYHTLTQLELPNETLVAVRCRKGRGQVIACLAVMMQGSAYLPMELAWPDGRCQTIISQAAVPLVLTDQDIDKSENSSLKGCQALCINEFVTITDAPASPEKSLRQQQLLASYQEKAPLDNLAYVIFTSGSTGNPKGVAIEHHMAVNTILDINQQYQIDQQDKVLVVSNLSFDLSVYDIFGMLACGGTAVFPHHELAKEPGHWLQCVEEHEVTVWDTVPASAGMLVDCLMSEKRPCRTRVRHIMMSGDWIPPGLPARLMAHFPSAKLHSLGGATEGSIWSIHYPITENTDNWPSIPYGKPLSNQKFLILNEALEPVPIGVEGHLFIGGRGVAREYYGAPELTAKSFLIHPVTQERLYATGDLGRYREDGNIIFVGRTDHQVKVRGFRIELGEIEAALKTLDSVDSCIVKVMGEGSRARLVAYIVPDSHCGLANASQQALTSHLKEHLASVLADYMIPSAFVVLPKFQLTANGKIDHKALPDIDETELLQTRYVAPETLLQQQLCQLFESVLGQSQVGIDDDFFELGGHSLLANQIVTQVRQLTHSQVPLRAVFENPSVRSFSDFISKNQQQGFNRQPLLPQPKNQLPVLSFAQQRMWFDEQLEAGQCKYNMVTAFDLHGDLQPGTLNRAFQAVLHRHQVLRSVYNSRDDGVEVQLLLPEGFAIEVCDLRAETLQLSDVEAATQQFMMTPFDLEGDYMLAVRLLQIASGQWRMLVRLHHIASDGLSVEILVNDVCESYGALLKVPHLELEEVLPQLNIQYSDYASWQRQWLTQSELQRHLDYWLSQLHGIPELHSLPLSKPRPARQSFQGVSLYFTVEQELLQRIEDCVKQRKVTLFSFLETAFAMCLAIYSDERDIVIGTPVNGREDVSLAKSIGLFLNLLLVRTRLDSDSSFVQLLEQNNQSLLQAFEYQHLPFEYLIEALQPERSLSHNPLCQIKFVLQNYQQGQVSLPGVTVDAVKTQNEVTRFDLDLTAMQEKDRLVFEWTYKTELFNKEDVTRMAQGFFRLLELVCEQPEMTLPDVQNQLAFGTHEAHTPAKSPLEGKSSDTQRNENLIHLLEESIAQNDSAVAISDSGCQLSYQQLQQQMLRLAAGLQKLDIGPGLNVVILGQRSVEVLLTILAVMKTGATYIAIEPSLNAERIHQIIADTDAELVLMQKSFSNTVDTTSVDTLYIDGCTDPDFCFAGDTDDVFVAPDISIEDNAYILFTSGSTGTPKGVVVGQQALTDYCIFARDNYYLNEASLAGSFVVTSHGFDISVPSLFLPLLCGGEVRLSAPKTEIESLAALLSNATTPWLVRMTPSHLVALNSLLEGRELPFVKHIFVIGGEALNYQTIRPLYKQLPTAQFYNHYGPSEATVGCLMHAIKDVSDSTSQEYKGQVPIGSVMDNTFALVVNSEGHSVTRGTIGELWVSGVGLAKGYLNQPQLSAERFPVRDNRRFYRTGDLVRCNGQGLIEFVGRQDSQISLNGFRIELNDIRTQLLQYPGAQQAVVLTHSSLKQASTDGDSPYESQQSGDTKSPAQANEYIVAYIAGEVNSTEVKAWLKQKLPGYMLPKEVICLPEIPLNANGKLDEQALPTINLDGAQRRTTVRRTASTPNEKILTEVFASVLGANAQCMPGVDDNFFALGGDSISAIQAIAKAAKSGLSFTLQDLFENPTIEQLSKIVETTKVSQASRSSGEIELSPIQAAFFAQRRPSSHHYNQSLMLQIPQNIDLDTVKKVFAALISCHDSLRQFMAQPDAMGFSEDEALILERAVSEFQLADDNAEQQITKHCEKLQESFDLQLPPLFKVCLFTCKHKSVRLFMTFHHLLVDGVSWRVLLEDLQQLFDQLQSGKPLFLSPQSMSLQQWHQQLDDYYNSNRLHVQKSYWLQQLNIPVQQWLPGMAEDNCNASEPDTVDEHQAFSFQLSFDCDPQTTAQLQGDANQAYNTRVEDLLLAALSSAMKLWTQKSVFRFNLENHGRVALDKQLQPSRMLGWLTTYFPLVVDTQKGQMQSVVQQNTPDHSSLIKLVKETYRDIPDNGLGYNALVHKIADEEVVNAQRKALPDAVEFNYLGQFDASLNTSDVFAVASDNTGSDIYPNSEPKNPIYVNAIVISQTLKVNLVFDKQRICRAKAQALATYFEQHIKDVTQHCLIINQIKQNQQQPVQDSTAISATDSEAQDIQEFSI